MKSKGKKTSTMSDLRFYDFCYLHRKRTWSSRPVSENRGTETVKDVFNKRRCGLLVDQLLRHGVIKDMIVNVAPEFIACAAAFVKENSAVRRHLDAGYIVGVEHRSDTYGDLWASWGEEKDDFINQHCFTIWWMLVTCNKFFALGHGNS